MPDIYDTRLPRDAVFRETEHAYLFIVPRNGGGTQARNDREVWVPKSQVTWIDRRPYGETAHLPHWLARKVAL